ncbi:MAG: ACT domain-containing protein [Actinobacteria bacterium]|nr:MAG: ACT domain-containing protein [Actinomycetota bacterium]
MAVTQLSIFLDNTAGRLAEVARVLGEAGINIRGFSIADTADYGILRLIVGDEARAAGVLRENRFTVHEGPVILARVPDIPGGLSKALEGFAKRGLNVEYAYLAVPAAVIAFGVDEKDVEAAERILLEEGIPIVTEEELRAV